MFQPHSSALCISATWFLCIANVTQRHPRATRARRCGISVSDIGYREGPGRGDAEGGAWGRQAPHERRVPRTRHRQAIRQLSTSLATRAVRCTVSSMHGAHGGSKLCLDIVGCSSHANKTCSGTFRSRTDQGLL
jgi:hypothetical protein